MLYENKLRWKNTTKGLVMMQENDIDGNKISPMLGMQINLHPGSTGLNKEIYHTCSCADQHSKVRKHTVAL